MLRRPVMQALLLSCEGDSPPHLAHLEVDGCPRSYS